jgi:hypothetical protein
MSTNATESPVLSIRQSLSEDAWEGHEDPLMSGDLDAITATVAKAASDIAMEQFDAFLSSPGLDPAWIAGWHSAVKHVAAVLAKQGTAQQDTAQQ